MTPYTNFWIFETPGFRHPFAASFQSQLLLSWSTSLWKSHGSDLLWSEYPFMSQDINLNSWADCLRAWPNPPESWITWYSRVAKTYMPLWQELNIADALSLSLSPLDKDENLLKTIGYFWSDALNCFLFGHGPMTPALLDVTMITGLDIRSQPTEW